MKPLPFDLPPEYVATLGELAAECDVSRWTLAEVRNRDKRFPRKTPYGWPVCKAQILLSVRLLESVTDAQYDAALLASGQDPAPGARQEAIDYWLAILHETTSA